MTEPLPEIAPDGAFSFLDADRTMGWRRLVPALQIDGEVRRPSVREVRRDAGGARWTATLAYPDIRVVERVEFRLRTGGALTVERHAANEGVTGVDIERSLVTLDDVDSAVLMGAVHPWDVRFAHCNNVRIERSPVWRPDYPYVRPVPREGVSVGDSEDSPLPVLLVCDRQMKQFLVEGSLQQQALTQTWTFRAHRGPRPVRDAGAASVFGEYAAVALDAHSQAVRIGPGESLCVGSHFYDIRVDTCLDEVLDGYLDALAERTAFRGSSSPLRRSAVYCTWNYGVFRDIDEKVLRARADFVGAHLPGTEYFLIDDGYQREGGVFSWDCGKFYPRPRENFSRDKFPSGMKATADGIREAGLRPAIWWTPAVGADGMLAREHPDWLASDAHGRPWTVDGRQHCLDFSLSAVREFVRGVLETLFAEWTYEGIKLDFWSAPFEVRGVRLRHGQSVRRRDWLLRTIRDCLPSGGFLMTCCSTAMGNPFPAEQADCYRIGIDIGRGTWDEHVKACNWVLPLLSVPGRRTYLMDVDSLGINPDLSDAENLSRLTWGFITQGVIEVAGELDRLSERQIGWLRRITSHVDRGYRVHCPDALAFTGEPFPHVLCVDYPPESPTFRRGIRTHIAFLNWEDEPADVCVRAASLGLQDSPSLTDFWTGEAVSADRGRIAVSLAARGARLLEQRM